MNVRTLYFSADQDEWTTMTRLAACLSGDTPEGRYCRTSWAQGITSTPTQWPWPAHLVLF